MAYPKFLKQGVFRFLSVFYRLTGIAKRKVLVKSIKTFVEFDGRQFPQREFYALTKHHKEMAHGKVMVGRFQKYQFHYCVLTGVYVKPLYRRRGLAEKLMKARIELCAKEGFANVLSAVELHNSQSIALHEKCGFRRVREEEWPDWMQLEAEVYNIEFGFWLYQIKKPAR